MCPLWDKELEEKFHFAILCTQLNFSKMNMLNKFMTLFIVLC